MHLPQNSEEETSNRIIFGTMREQTFRTLKEMEGDEIVAMIPLLSSETFEVMKLHKVEDYGIWIEHEPTLEKFFKLAKRTAAPKTLVLFVPWSGVTAIFGSLDVPSLPSEVMR